jgi:Acyltransferase
MDLYTRRHLAGREHLDDLTGLVVFVANHNSQMDTPVILRALPSRWLRRTAVAAAADYFYYKRRNALSASLAFGTVPLERSSGAGVGPGQTAHPRHPLEIRFGKPIAPRAGERPSEVMERVRLFLAECGAGTERETHAEHASRRQPA